MQFTKNKVFQFIERSENSRVLCTQFTALCANDGKAVRAQTAFAFCGACSCGVSPHTPQGATPLDLYLVKVTQTSADNLKERTTTR